jgi:hypothetical protein
VFDCGLFFVEDLLVYLTQLLLDALDCIDAFEESIAGAGLVRFRVLMEVFALYSSCGKYHAKGFCYGVDDD